MGIDNDKPISFPAFELQGLRAVEPIETSTPTAAEAANNYAGIREAMSDTDRRLIEFSMAGVDSPEAKLMEQKMNQMKHEAAAAAEEAWARTTKEGISAAAGAIGQLASIFGKKS